MANEVNIAQGLVFQCHLKRRRPKKRHLGIIPAQGKRIEARCN